MKRYICRVFTCVACVAFLGLLCVLGASAESSELGGDLNLPQWRALAVGVDDQYYLTAFATGGTSSFKPFLITAINMADQYKIYVYGSSGDVYVTGGGSSATAGATITTNGGAVYRYEYSTSYGMRNPGYVALQGSFALRANEYPRMSRSAGGGWSYNTSILPASVPFGGVGATPAWVAWTNARGAFDGTFSMEQAISSRVDEIVEAEKQSWYWQGANWQAGEDIPLINNARDEGYAQGKLDGRNEALESMGQITQSYFLDIGSIISSYVDSAIGFIQSILSFDLFGVNLAGVFGAIIASLILGFIVALLVKLFGLLV